MEQIGLHEAKIQFPEIIARVCEGKKSIGSARFFSIRRRRAWTISTFTNSMSRWLVSTYVDATRPCQIQISPCFWSE